MTDIANLIIKVNSTDVEGATDDLSKLSKTSVTTGKATDGLTKQTAKSSQMFKLQKGAAQQAGFQIQDFAVQVGSGQSALVAFGQQASQLAGILGPGGALLGAVIAIGSALGGVLLTSFNSVNDEAEEFEDRMNRIRENLQQSKFRQVSEDITLQRKAIEELNKAFDDLDYDKLEDLTGAEGGLFGASRADIIGEARVLIGVQQEALDVLLDQQKKYKDESGRIGFFPDISPKDDPILQRVAAAERADKIIKQLNVDRLKEEERSLREFRKLQDQLDPVAALQSRHFDQLDLIDSYNITVEEKEHLREQAFAQHMERMAAIAGKGSSVALGEMEKGVEESTEMLSDTQSNTLGVTADILGDAADLAAQGGKDTFTQYKALAASQAAISSSLAILSVLGDPLIPAPLKPAAATVMGALAAVQVGAIATQEYSGARAMGGQVSAGSSYLVGERGPEVLTLGVSGGITPNHALGGENVTVNNVFQISAGVADTVRAEILRAAPQIAEMSKASVSAAISNGGQLSRQVGRRT